MRGIELAVIATALALLGPASAAPNACGSIKGFTLSLTPVEEGYLLPMAVAGTPRTFLLETEAAYSKLDEAVAAELKLPLKDVPSFMEVKDTHGLFAKIATAPTIGLGPIVRHKAEFLIGAHRAGWGIAVGVVGANFFYGLDEELDLGHNRLGLYLPRDCPFTPFWPAEVYGEATMVVEPTGGFHMPMRLDGHAIEVRVTSSEKRTYMPLSAAHILYGIEKGDPALVPIGMRDTGEALYRYPFKALIGGYKVTIENPEIFIYENKDHQCGG